MSISDSSPAEPHSLPSLESVVPLSFNQDPKLSPGWCAIDEALANLYPKANAVHVAPPILYGFGGSDPLNGISAFDVSCPSFSSPNGMNAVDKSGSLGDLDTDDLQAGDLGESTRPVVNHSTKRSTQSSSVDHSKVPFLPRHWHFITYGFSELFAKSQQNSTSVSGFGFELTFRFASTLENDNLSKTHSGHQNQAKTNNADGANAKSLLQEADAKEAPKFVGLENPSTSNCPLWAFSFLQGLARYVFSSGVTFDIGHHLLLNGALDDASTIEQPKGNIVAVMFVQDPALPPIETPNGQVKFLQVVGLTQDEYELLWESNAKFVAELISASNPFLITSLERTSVLSNPETLQIAKKYIEDNGSSMSSIYHKQIAWKLEPKNEGDQSHEAAHQTLKIVLGANIVIQFCHLLQRRIPYSRELLCVGTDPQTSCAITFKPHSDIHSNESKSTKKQPTTKKAKRSSKQSISWTVNPDDSAILTLELTTEHVNDIVNSLLPKQGDYVILKDSKMKPILTISVVPTIIKDSTGTQLVRIVGE